MAVWRYVHFEDKEAQRLADLNGIQSDLELACSFCDQFLQLDGTESQNAFIVSQALFMAAIVAYGRTLGSGVRTGITPQQIEQLSPERQERHRYFKDIRDKFVAHSVNAFEESVVKIYLTPEERGERSVSSIGLGHARVATLSHLNMSYLKDLSLALLDTVKAEMKVEQDRVLAYAQSLPVDDFYNAPEPGAFTGGNVAPARPRRRLGEG